MRVGPYKKRLQRDLSSFHHVRTHATQSGLFCYSHPRTSGQHCVYSLMFQSIFLCIYVSFLITVYNGCIFNQMDTMSYHSVSLS